jgi:hypothetical protein
MPRHAAARVYLRQMALARAQVWLAVLSVLALAPRAAFAQAGDAAPAHAASGAAGPEEGAAQPPGQRAPGDEAEVKMSRIVRSNFETSYFAYPIGLSGLPSLIFESSIAAHFYVSQPSWPLAFVLTPKIVVRMFNEPSVPVKTPSYMPRVSFYAWLTQKLSPGEWAGYASLTLSHHSNGQDGPFFLDDRSINHDDGGFSTNYFELALYGTRLGQMFFGWNQVALVWHPGFNQDSELRGRYGMWRVYLATTLLDAERPLNAKLQVGIGAILDSFLHATDSSVTRALERFPIAVQYTVTVPGFDLGFYAGYYLGHDYYNIWFDRWVHAIQVGISGRVGPVMLD